MRVGLVAAWLLVLAMLSGCLRDEDRGLPVEPALDPLPPPRSKNPDNNIGLDAVMDRSGRVPASAWSTECVRQWTSGNYTYREPPVVQEAPCLFYPTSEGTLFWHVVDAPGEHRNGVPAAPVPRNDGFFDWFVFHQASHDGPGGEVRFYENGSLEPAAVWPDYGNGLKGPPSAVRLSDGGVHLLLYDWAEEVDLTLGRGTLHHFWLPAGGQPQHEVLASGSVFNEHTWRATGPAAYAIGTLASPAAPDAPVTNVVFVTQGGALEALPPLPGMLFDVVPLGNQLHACIGTAGGYVHASLDVELPVWSFEPIATSPLAPVAFTCDITTSDAGLVVIVDTPAPIGGGPNPTGGSTAFTRGPDGIWSGVSTGTTFWSGDDLVTGDHGPSYLVLTGAGTSTVDPQCGVKVLQPERLDPRNDWHVLACNHPGDWAYLLDGQGTPVVVANAMLNPPFATWDFDLDGSIEQTSVAWALPLGTPV